MDGAIHRGRDDRRQESTGTNRFTRLVADDYVRLTDCARAKGRTITAIARTAIREYLQRYEDQQESERESKYAAQVQASTNRTCSLLAKVAIDVRAMYRFLGDVEDMHAQIEQCRAMAIHEISRRLTPDERTVLDGIPPRCWSRRTVQRVYQAVSDI